jgi:AcrR family transcriptional regulator
MSPGPAIPADRAMRRAALVNADARTRLLSAGERLFTQRPYGGVAVEEIARLAGVSSYQLYKLFRNKAQFVLAVAQHMADRVDALQLQSTTQATPEEAIRVLLTAQVDSANMRRSSFVEDFRALPDFDEELRAIWDGCRGRSIGLVCAALKIESRAPELYALLSAWFAFFDELLVATRRAPNVLPQQILDTSVASLHSMLHNYSLLDPVQDLSRVLPLYSKTRDRRLRGQPLTGRRLKLPPFGGKV